MIFDTTHCLDGCALTITCVLDMDRNHLLPRGHTAKHAWRQTSQDPNPTTHTTTKTTID